MLSPFGAFVVLFNASISRLLWVSCPIMCAIVKLVKPAKMMDNLHHDCVRKAPTPLADVKCFMRVNILIVYLATSVVMNLKPCNVK